MGRIGILLATLLTAPSAWAGPWTHGPGHGYSKAWPSLIPGVGWSAELGSTLVLTGWQIGGPQLAVSVSQRF